VNHQASKVLVLGQLNQNLRIETYEVVLIVRLFFTPYIDNFIDYLLIRIINIT
jgi:hypothetical protein